MSNRQRQSVRLEKFSHCITIITQMINTSCCSAYAKISTT